MILDITKPEDYDIACALRGPDLPNTNTLKWALTCRIRHLAGCALVGAPARALSLSLNGARGVLEEVEGRQNELSHYVYHVGVAARMLGDDGLERLVHALSSSRLPAPEVVVRLAGGDDA